MPWLRGLVPNMSILFYSSHLDSFISQQAAWTSTHLETRRFLLCCVSFYIQDCPLTEAGHFHDSSLLYTFTSLLPAFLTWCRHWEHAASEKHKTLCPKQLSSNWAFSQFVSSSPSYLFVFPSRSLFLSASGLQQRWTDCLLWSLH